MCAIIGALLKNIDTEQRVREVNDFINIIWRLSHERGRDGRGYKVNYDISTHSSGYKSVTPSDGEVRKIMPFLYTGHHINFIGNLRAEPTTEYISEKHHDDQQPYKLNGWNIVHNGTIANDKELRTELVPSKIDSCAIVEDLARYDNYPSLSTFADTVGRLKGSFAILATHNDKTNEIFVACNYRPIWYIATEYGIFFASARHYFPFGFSPQMVEPYTVNSFSHSSDPDDYKFYLKTYSLRKEIDQRRALVVCSGGLDSVVAATVAQRKLGYDIELLHFQYGSRAQTREWNAMVDIAHELQVRLHVMPIPIYKESDSPLLNRDSKIAGGEVGAEFAHEWVPARNLVMLSIATAFAEANGFDTIILGNNMEEAGAYPDNEPEFISKFNDLLPFAVADGKRIQVEMPVGNLVKHEIVALGQQVGAPLALTWSCYRNGEKHCGTCGPCYMRRTAFAINNIPEVVEYENDTHSPAIS